MESNEPVNKEEMNPYLKSTLTGLALSGAMELGGMGIHRLTKNRENEGLQNIHEKMNTILYAEGASQQDFKDVFDQMNLDEDKANKYSKKLANNSVVNFMTSGLSTTKGRVNAYGLGTLTGLAFTALGEKMKEKDVEK